MLRLISRPSNLSGEDVSFFLLLEYVLQFEKHSSERFIQPKNIYETFSSDGWVCSVFSVAKRITERCFAVGVVHLIPRFYAIV